MWSRAVRKLAEQKLKEICGYQTVILKSKSFKPRMLLLSLPL